MAKGNPSRVHLVLRYLAPEQRAPGKTGAGNRQNLCFLLCASSMLVLCIFDLSQSSQELGSKYYDSHFSEEETENLRSHKACSGSYSWKWASRHSGGRSASVQSLCSLTFLYNTSPPVEVMETSIALLSTWHAHPSL